ncbi:MAG: MFS transporter [Deltaproteobacteria bacterium]|nr:MAG: MFS transporter [Deltaproteobacteria bacterium]
MERTPLTSYQKKLLFFLSVATFFEGYDFMALTQILPNLRESMGISVFGGTAMVAFINFGTMVAYVLIRKADVIGRRQMLMVTIVGYTIFTLISGFSTNVYMFAITQFVARVFLIGEWLVSMIYAAEEFPSDRRGMVIGIIQACSSLGAVVCAGVVPLLLKSSLGWRLVYFVGVIPLILIAFARRNIKESQRFTEGETESGTSSSLFAIFKTPYRNRMLLMAAIWCLTYMCTHNAITFWKEYALGEQKMSDGQVGLIITVGALAAMPLVFFAGKLLDVWGRKAGSAVIYIITIVGVIGAYTFDQTWAQMTAMIFAVFGVTACLSVMNTYSTELFPTNLRANAFAWANNLLGRIGYVFSPLLIGVCADTKYLGWGWGLTMQLSTIFPFIALALVLAFLPETRNRSLEETSAL